MDVLEYLKWRGRSDTDGQANIKSVSSNYEGDTETEERY